MNRRGFLAGILAGTAAPSIVRSESLMRLWVPPQGVWHRGGICSNEALDLNVILEKIAQLDQYSAAVRIVTVGVNGLVLEAPCVQMRAGMSNVDYMSHPLSFVPSCRELAKRDEFSQPGRTK